MTRSPTEHAAEGIQHNTHRRRPCLSYLAVMNVGLPNSAANKKKKKKKKHRKYYISLDSLWFEP